MPGLPQRVNVYEVPAVMKSGEVDDVLNAHVTEVFACTVEVAVRDQPLRHHFRLDRAAQLCRGTM